jgi:hypothetical protein
MHLLFNVNRIPVVLAIIADSAQTTNIMATRLFAFVLLLMSAVHAQQPATRFVHVAVTDPMNRFVAGLNRTHFVVRENGVQRNIATIGTPKDSIAIAVVADGDLNIATDQGMRFYTAKSVREALRMIADDAATRKALIVTTAEMYGGVPGNVFVQNVNRELIEKAVVEAVSRYVLGFTSADTATTAAVEINQPAGLPPLKAVY